MRSLQGIAAQWRRLRAGTDHGLLTGDSVISAVESALDLLATLRLVRARPTTAALRAGIQVCDRAHAFIGAVTPLLLLHPALAAVAFRAYTAMEVVNEVRLFLRLLLRMVTWLRERGGLWERAMDEELGEMGEIPSEVGFEQDNLFAFNEFPEFGEPPENPRGSLR